MSASDKSSQSQKPPDYDEEFTQAVDKFREQHKLPADDAVLLLVELFRIHQHHWDDLRRREVDAAATDEREENSEKQTVTKSIPQTRRTAVRV